MSSIRNILSPRILVLVSFAVLLKFLVLASIKRFSLGLEPYSVANDFPRVFPVGKLADVRMYIEDTAHFQMEDDADWDALSPGDGLVYLGDDRQPYTPSMFHQLRCLNIIRKAVVDLEALGTDEVVEPSDLGHHCVNYLRQMVLCRGDLELDLVLGKPYPNVFPDTYQCKDWEAVYQEVEKNQQLYGPGH